MFLRSFSQSSVCVDIGTDSIKWMNADLKGEKVVVSQLGVLNFPPGSYSHHGSAIQIEMLEEFLDSHKSRKPYIVSLSDSQIPSQMKQFPDIPASEIRDAVKWELSQNKRHKLEDLQFDYLVCQPDYEKEAQQKNLMIAIRPKVLIENIEKAFSRRKLILTAIENPSFAQASAIRHAHLIGSSTQSYVVLHMGSSATLFWVFHHGQLVFERKLSTGGESLTKSIMDYCKIDFENATKLKEEYGIGDTAMSDRIIEAKQILISVLEKLASDIQYSIKYYSFQVTKSKVTTFDKIYLTGGTSHLPGFMEFLSERLKQPCEILQEDTAKVMWPKTEIQADHLFSMYGTALGLAYWNHKDLNVLCSSFLSESVNNRQELTKTTREKIYTGLGSVFVWLGVFCGLIVLATFYCVQSKAIIQNTENRLSAQESMLKKLKQTLELELVHSREQDSMIEELNKQKAVVDDQIKKVKAIHVENISYAKHISLLSRHIPASVVFESMQFNRSNLILEGFSKNHKLIAELMSYLNQGESFYNADFKLIEVDEMHAEAWISFKIGAGVKHHG